MSSARATRRTPPRQQSTTGRFQPWVRFFAFALCAAVLVGWFASPISDTDFWWHLKTGQYIVQQHALPVPDPFSYTTPRNSPVAHFNLTHEWLSQVLLYLTWAAGGFPAVVTLRAFLLTAICGLAGILSGRAGGNWIVGIVASFATASVAFAFAADRPALVTFLFAAMFLLMLELDRATSILPLLSLLWANCHGGFFVGWIILFAYAIERRTRRYWLIAVVSLLASGLNSNGFGVLSTLVHYRQSPATANLIEWHAPSLWGSPYGFDLLLYGSAVTLFFARKRVRLAHWILFIAFAAASLAAFRNILLIGILAPVLIAMYLPWRMPATAVLEWPMLAVLACVLTAATAGRAFFRTGVNEWTVPTATADYIAAKHITSPLFNTYEQGGYLIWRLWPQERVFIDGRALSESGQRDYHQILFNPGSAQDQLAGPRAELIVRYGIQTVAMNTIDEVSGAIYPLALALANPAEPSWALVHEDTYDVVFQHNAAPEAVLGNKLGRVLNHLDVECTAYIEHAPDLPNCARTLAQYWTAYGVPSRAQRMRRLYLEHAPENSPN